ncbi:MAG: class I SAM-dependent methyltransferase [Candidatus Margulisiibacteriota bacterium]
MYDRNQSAPYVRLLDEGARHVVVNPAGRYLDLGCGSGNSTLAIGRRLNADGGVIGIDSSPHALELAREKGVAGRLNNVDFQQGDIGRPLPFDGGTFDGILANNSFYLISDPKQTLVDVMRLLKPGGVFLMTNPKEAANPSEIFKNHLAVMKEKYAFRYGRTIGGLALAGHTLHAVFNYALLLPFQFVLKNSYKVESHFWPVEKWSGILEEARRETPYPFAIRPPFLTYAEQNHTFIVDRLMP